MVVGTLCARPLLELLNTPESIIDWCASYLIIMMLGSSGIAYYNILCGILRGLGDSVSALIYLLIATVINIVLDVTFVAVFHMGVPGVALATVIAQIASAVMCMIKLKRMSDLFDLKPQYLKPNGHHAWNIIRLGLPSGITQAIFSMAMVVVQSLTNSFGEMVIAANVIIMRVDGFAMMPNFSFGTALTTFAGQNVGARRYDRVEQGAKQGTLMAVGTSTVITVMILVFGRYLMAIFTNTSELVTLSANMMRILAVGYIAMAVTQSLSGVMRGRRYNDAYVDLSDHNRRDPCAGSLRNFLADQNPGAAQRTVRMYLDFPAVFLADGSPDHLHLLPQRKMENQGS